MVQGLAFLSKKSWHTKNKNNQEKVWLAEELKRAEEQKTAELTKQIQQEIEQAELDQLTGKQHHRDRGIDWMYQGSNPQSQIAQEDAKKEAEEYLLGKEYVPAGGLKGDLDMAESTTEGVHAVLAAAAPAASVEQHGNTAAAFAEPSVQERNEAFRMRHEDPMFAVSRRAVEQQQKYDKKKELFERVVGGVAVDVKKQELDNPKKNKRDRRHGRKSDKKERRRRHRDEASFSDSSDSDDRSDRGKSCHRRRKRSRSRSSSYDSSPARNTSSSGSQLLHRDRRSRRSSTPSPSHRQRSSHGRRRSPSWDRRSRSPEHRRDRRHAHQRGDRAYDDRRHRSDHDHHSSRRHVDERYDDDRKQPPRQLDARLKSPPRSNPSPPWNSNKDGYGLQGARSNGRTGDLGPDKNLLRQKRQELEDERRRGREAALSRRQLTAEERAEAVRAMENDAKRRQESRVHAKRTDKEEEDTPTRGNATFLYDMQKAAHGMSGTESMSERLQQNRNTNQSRNGSFL